MFMIKHTFAIIALVLCLVCTGTTYKLYSGIPTGYVGLIDQDGMHQFKEYLNTSLQNALKEGSDVVFLGKLQFRDKFLVYNVPKVGTNPCMSVDDSIHKVISCASSKYKVNIVVTVEASRVLGKMYTFAFERDGNLAAIYKRAIYRRKNANIDQHVLFASDFGVVFGMIYSDDIYFNSPKIGLYDGIGIRNFICISIDTEDRLGRLDKYLRQGWSKFFNTTLIDVNIDSGALEIYQGGAKVNLNKEGYIVAEINPSADFPAEKCINASDLELIPKKIIHEFKFVEMTGVYETISGSYCDCSVEYTLNRTGNFYYMLSVENLPGSNSYLCVCSVSQCRFSDPPSRCINNPNPDSHGNFPHIKLELKPKLECDPHAAFPVLIGKDKDISNADYYHGKNYTLSSGGDISYMGIFSRCLGHLGW